METPIRVLIWADLLSFYAMWVLMTYLTEVWKLSVTHAAGILNLWGGIILTLPIGFAYLVDTILGCTRMLALSSIFYSIGLGLLAMSTPPVLYKSTGTCKEYEPDCIGNTQKVLFYIALAFIAIGMSGHIVSLKQVLDQNRNASSGNRRRVRKRELLLALFTVVGGIALPYIKPWSIRFGIPAIFTLAATIIFLSGSCLYEKDELKGSPITNIFRVFVASASKISQQLPGNQNLYEGDAPHKDRLSHTDGLRCLDKAAIELPNQERNRWQLCTVTEVEETKIAIRMIPMWMTFVICGLVSSAGSTYFQEQANNLSRDVGKLKVPLPILVLLQQSAKSLFTKMYMGLKNTYGTLQGRRYAVSVGIPGAMIFATLSCIAAAILEAERLDVIRSHDLIDKPEDTIPLNIFAVLPQFVMLAGLEAFFENSVTEFLSDQSPASMAKYLDYLTHGVSGLGYMASVLSVYVVGKISERGANSNWFQYTLNKSRLDNYYWTLSAMCAANLFVYILVARFYPYRVQTSNSEEQQDEEQQDVEKLDET